MPDISHKLNLPFALPSDHPLQVGIARPALTVHPSILQLREMALEEADLMLVGCAWDISSRSLYREMVVDSALVDGSCCLRDKLCSPHIRIPFRSVVNGDFSALFRVRVRGILVARRQVHVFCNRARPVNVVLIITNLIAP